MTRILLIDLSSGYFPVLSEYHDLYLERLRTEDLLKWRRNRHLTLRGNKTYSRGLLSIAACLEKEGHEVLYHHFGFLSPTAVSRVLSGALRNVQIVGVTCVTPTFPLAVTILEQVKKLDSEVLTVLGGNHATALARKIIAEHGQAVDVVVRGEGEITMVELALNPSGFSGMRGVTYARDCSNGFSAVVENPDQKPTNLASIPLPAYHLLRPQMADYAHNVMAARGCPFDCDFCVDGHYFSSFHCPHIEHTIAELKHIRTQVPSGTLVHFSDSVFNTGKAYVDELVTRLAEEQIGLSFSCDLLVGLVTENLARKMSAAGFIQYCLGIETGDDSLLIQHKQRQKLRTSIEACRTLRRWSPEAFIVGYWLTGLPGTTPKSLEQDTAVIQELVRDEIVDRISNKIMVPYPGTPIYGRTKEFGLSIRHSDWSKYLRNRKPVYDLVTIDAEGIYSWFLHEEDALLRAYRGLLRTSVSDYGIVASAGGHLFRQYFANPEKMEGG